MAVESGHHPAKIQVMLTFFHVLMLSGHLIMHPINATSQVQDLSQDTVTNPIINSQKTTTHVIPNTKQDVMTMAANTTQSLSFPEPTGPHAVGTTSLYFADREREEFFTEDPNDYREITARIWYPSEVTPGTKTAPYMDEALSNAFASGIGIPADEFTDLIQSMPTHSVMDAPVAAEESDYPVLFLSHGGSDMPEFNTFRAEELASQGYVVVSINHTYDSALNIFPDGRVAYHDPASVLNNIDTEGSDLEPWELQAEKIVSIRAGDMQFVLDELEKFNAGDDPTGLFEGKLDLGRLGVLGISTGGATAAEVLSIDPRFKAGVNLDGTLRGDTPEASLSQPYLQFNNVAFGTEISSDGISRRLDGQGQPFLNNLQNNGYEVTILGSTHLHYTSDVPFLFPLMQDAGIELGDLAEPFAYFFDPQSAVEVYTHENFERIDPNRMTQITNDYISAFLDQHLNHQASPLLTDSASPCPEAYPEVITQFYKDDTLLSDRDGNDVLSGTRENDVLYGGRGDDILNGRQGDDALHGGAGANALFGGQGNDFLFGHNDNDRLRGGAGDDFLHGDGGDDVLRGGRGNDSLIGGAGDDRMNGGEADDILSGEAGDDVLKDTQGNNSLYGDAGNDWLRAGQGTDVLQGNSGNDTLMGGAGDDSLHGGADDDLLIGGAGLDRFHLSRGQDIIRDFEDGYDVLTLPMFNDDVSVAFSDLQIVQLGQNTEIRWASQDINELGNPMNVTVLQSIDATQITEADFNPTP